MKALALTLYLLARVILALISSSAIIGCFQKVNYKKGIILVTLDFELPSAFLYESRRSLNIYAVLCGNNSVSVKIRDSLLFVTNRCIKVTRK